ncbi:MAG: hypothetical protein CSA60_03250 [Neptuniibacter caesariensis]|uniref:DUF2835 domain-containing protein n=1 Tax=Neptuniibacter caesariensis TaxID=207954 RepID=A0A2G6JLB1_NEPCE|nr:MAG: hypothetical protein CSA60_03250 [Neptuniibacter caesariensis]
MKYIVIDLYISSDKYKKLYQGVAQNIFTHAIDGRSVQFPARILQPFLLSDGIRGRFRIQFDDDGKYRGIEKIS